MNKIIPQNLKNVYHLFQAILANLIYSFPSKKIKVIGITGTDGKTTTAQMVAKVLEEAGYSVAMASTLNFKLGEKEWRNKTKFTTLSSFQVQKFIRQAVDAECEYLVLETSSHSLDQNRVWGVKYKTAVLTNVTREHLDYHETMEKYRQAKMKLFKNVENAIVNLDMENPEDFLRFNSKNKFGYTTKPVGQMSGIKIIKAKNIELGINGSSFKVNNSQFKINLPGLFNIENALAMICVGIAEGISLEKISQALKKIEGVPGRFESVPNDKGFNIIVDFALTPDSFEKLHKFLVGMKRKPETKIISVFGACGDRDRGKRPIIGKIASQYADVVILTNDEPHNEDPEQIINDIKNGIENKIEGDSFYIIPDRREAIKKALQIAKPDDIVAFTGMGAEELMVIGDKKIPWNEKEVILEELEKLK